MLMIPLWDSLLSILHILLAAIRKLRRSKTIVRLIDGGSETRVHAVALAVTTFLTASFLSLRLPYVHNFRNMDMQVYSYASLAQSGQGDSGVYKDLATKYLRVSEEYRQRVVFFSKRVMEGLMAIGLLVIAGLTGALVNLARSLRYVSAACFFAGTLVIGFSTLSILLGWFFPVNAKGISDVLASVIPGILSELPRWPWIQDVIDRSPYLQDVLRN